MGRFAPLAVLMFVTVLDLAYGSSSWSWLAGPVAAALVFALDRASRAPSTPAPAHRRDPAPVD
ncbi:MAG TPA: hypothetical protein VHC67_02185 [Gaiellaceae bacterium]|nr:hypothetical protein [Gaiellaceae bacterium]